jgi:hypothetical protein
MCTSQSQVRLSLLHEEIHGFQSLWTHHILHNEATPNFLRKLNREKAELISQERKLRYGTNAYKMALISAIKVQQQKVLSSSR